MATIADPGFPNIVNVTNAMNPQGGIETMMANTLTKELPMLDDIPWVEGNLATGHQINAVSTLPAVAWRRLNEGVAPTKGERVKFTEGCGMIEQFSVIDEAVAELNGNSKAFRANEDKVIYEAMVEEWARSMLYESTVTNPERLHGFAARYQATTGYTTSKYTQKVGTPSATACESIYVISWDPERIFGIYPKGSVAGLKQTDLGLRPWLDASSNPFTAYVTKVGWKPGLCVKDYRFAVRMQWDTADTTNCTDTQKGVYLGLINAVGTVRKILPSTRIYWSRTSRNKVSAQLGSNDNRYLEYIDKGGQLVEHFLGIPCRITDSLVAETAIS